VGDNTQEDFAVDCPRFASGQRRAQVTLEHREDRLDLPALAVDFLWKTTIQHLPVFRVNRAQAAVVAGAAPPGSREDALDAQLLAASDVSFLAFVTGVAQQRAERMPTPRLIQRGGELHHIRLGSPVDDRAQDQMALHVAQGRQFGVCVLIMAFVSPTGPRVMHRHMPGFHAGRVDRSGFACFVNQLFFAREVDGGVHEASSAPFFRRRSSA